MRTLFRIANHGVLTFLSLTFTGLMILIMIYSYIELQLPNVETLRDVHLQVPLRIYTRDGELMGEFGTKRRIPARLDQVPPLMVKAVLDTEDSRFYHHPGVDLISLARAAKAVVSSGKKVQGASTITMQVARNFFLTRKKTMWRKLNEILLALKIERDFPKAKILELYLNKIYFGHRAYGVAAAAQVYYGETLDQLTLAQMAMLAGLPQAPSANNPITNPSAALERREHVLSRMKELGDITEAQYEEAMRAPLTAKYHDQKIRVHAPYVGEMVRRVLVKKYGEDAAYNDSFVVTTTLSARLQQAANYALERGLREYDERHGYRRAEQNLGRYHKEKQSDWESLLSKIVTIHGMVPAAVIQVDERSAQALLKNGDVITIPWSGLSWARQHLPSNWAGPLPERASQVVREGDVIRVMTMRDGTWRLVQIPEAQAALVSLNPNDGAVLALVGGFSYAESHFNRVTQAERQPGSNFKPFIYAAALAKGDTLASLFNDAPIVLQDTGENSLWRPQNDNLKFNGPTRLREGLIKSRNLVSIRVLESTGISYALDYVSKFGFDTDQLPNTLSLALGSGTVTPLQLSRGFAVFANGGYLVRPYFIQKVVQQGKVLYESDPEVACESCIAPGMAIKEHDEVSEAPKAKQAPLVVDYQTAYLMTQALKDVIQHGTGKRAKVLAREDIAGKTGTTNEQMDAWFSGFNSKVVTTVWVGFDNRQTLHEYGAQAALPIWIDYMRQAVKSMPESTMPQPEGIVSVRIDPKTGLLAKPNQTDAIFEVFRKDHVPTQTTDASVHIDNHESSAATSNEDTSSGESEPLF